MTKLVHKVLPNKLISEQKYRREANVLPGLLKAKLKLSAQINKPISYKENPPYQSLTPPNRA